MKNRKINQAAIILFSLVLISSFYFFFNKKENPFVEVSVEKSNFLVTVPASGTIQPENKISIISPIAGRIEKLLVDEGATVRKGQILAWMSSTDRAALLDSARSQGKDAIKEWEDVYLPTPIIAPANGSIISKGVVVGQTISQQTTIFGLSDRLVIVADVDETDIGKIKINQTANIKVDSYPNLGITATVVKIAHQSQIKNAINSYEVLLSAKELPPEFRSGMTASIHFVYEDNKNAIVVPTWIAEGRENFATELKLKNINEPRKVKFGLSNGDKIEVLEGLSEGEILLVKQQKIFSDEKNNPLFGSGGGRKNR